MGRVVLNNGASYFTLWGELSWFKFLTGACYLGPSCLSSELSVILGGDFPFLLRPYPQPIFCKICTGIMRETYKIPRLLSVLCLDHLS